MRVIPKEDLELIHDAALAAGLEPVEHSAREFKAIHVKTRNGQRYWNPLLPETGHLAELMASCSIELYTDMGECNCVEAQCYDFYYGYSVSYGRAVINFPEDTAELPYSTRELRGFQLCRAAVMAAAMKTRFGRNRGGQPAQYGASRHLDRVIVANELQLPWFLECLRQAGIHHQLKELSGSFLDEVKQRDQYAPFAEELNQTAVYFNSASDIEDAVLQTIEHNPEHHGKDSRFPFNLHDYNNVL